MTTTKPSFALLRTALLCSLGFAFATLTIMSCSDPARVCNYNATGVCMERRGAYTCECEGTIRPLTLHEEVWANGVGGGAAHCGLATTVCEGRIIRGNLPVGRPGPPQTSLRANRDVELTKDAEILVTGALTREVVRGIVKEHAMEIHYCYEQALTQAPHVGKLVTTWHIDAAGLVTRVETDAEQVSAESLASCLSKKIATWRLPATGAGGERTVSYPFYFERGGS